MKRLQVLICSLSLVALAWGADVATEGTSYGGTTSAPTAASEPYWTVVGLSDGTVAVTKASYWTNNQHKTIVFPTEVSVTYNNTTGASMTATYTVSQIGDGEYGVYIYNGSTDVASEVTSVTTNGVNVATNAFSLMTGLTTSTITYNKGTYGTGIIPAGKKYSGTPCTLSNSTFYRTGYHQTGWTTIAGGSKVYELGGSYSTDEDLSLYPVWESGEPSRENTCFLRGADLTMVNYMEDWNAVYKYQDGTTGDVFEILQSYGVNLARLRLYNAPGTAIQYPDDSDYKYRTPYLTTQQSNGYAYAGPEDILDLALRAKQHDMQICLTFHLSDFWSNAGTQIIPSAWANVTTLATLKDSVGRYVGSYMRRMVAQGTTPEFVSVGNETNWGMLFQTLTGTTIDYGGYGDQMSQFAELFNIAYDSIKAVSPTTQVIFHHSFGHDGGITSSKYLFDQLINTHSMKVDIIGGSYYPYWASIQNSADNSPAGMLKWAAAMETLCGKPIMIMETGYSWTQYKPFGRYGGDYEGQLGMNGGYNEATEEGQKDFLKMLHEAIASNDNILGYMYWDPIFVDQQVGGSWIYPCWAEKAYQQGEKWIWTYQNNEVSNTTWFDYTGLPLKALYEEVYAWKDGCDEPFVFNNNGGDGKWSTAANWSTGALPTANDDIRIYAPCTVDIANAVAKSVVIATGSDGKNTYTGHLTIAPSGGLRVVETIQKASDGTFDALTIVSASDLLIEASSSGQGALVLCGEPGTAQATVQLYSKAYIDTNKHWQYIGIPFSNSPAAIDLFKGSYMYRWDEETVAGWNSVLGTTTLNAFAGYCITQSAAKTYNLIGTLCSTTTDKYLNLTYSSQSGSNLFANSWTAPLEIASFEDEDFSNSSIDKTIYIYNTGSLAEYDAVGGENNTGSSPGQYFAIPIHAAPYAEGLPTVIPPMQGFQVLTTEAGTLTLNYARLTVPTGSGVNTQPLLTPRREAEVAPEVLRLTVAGESSSDRLYLLQREDFADGFDNGWDGRKIAGDDGLVQLYAIHEGNQWSVSAQPAMVGTQVGFAAGVDKEYTLDVYYTGAQTLYLLDKETSIYLPISDGARYTFCATPSAAASPRFVITDTAATTANAMIAADDICNITVYDILGHEIMTVSSWASLSSLSAHQQVYFLRIQRTDGTWFTKKI